MLEHLSHYAEACALGPAQEADALHAVCNHYHAIIPYNLPFHEEPPELVVQYDRTYKDNDVGLTVKQIKEKQKIMQETNVVSYLVALYSYLDLHSADDMVVDEVAGHKTSQTVG